MVSCAFIIYRKTFMILVPPGSAGRLGVTDTVD
jgi:hypothetical protein